MSSERCCQVPGVSSLQMLRSMEEDLQSKASMMKMTGILGPGVVEEMV